MHLCASSQPDSNLLLEATLLPNLQLLQHLCSICRIIVICLEACDHAFEAIWSTSPALPPILCCSMFSNTCCSLCVPLEGLKRWLQGTGAACQVQPDESREWRCQAGQADSSPALCFQPQCQVTNLWIRSSAPSLAPAPSTAAASASAPPPAPGFDVLPSDCWHVWASAAEQAVQGSD